MRLSWRTWRKVIVVSLLLITLRAIPFFQGFVIDTTSPVIQFMRQRGEAVIDGLRVVRAIPMLARENGVLRQQLNELTALQSTNAELKHENMLLRQELQFASSNQKDKLLAAQVISRSSSVNQETILINKGSQDGMKKNMAIIAQGYLVGQVQEVFDHTSRVVLITSAHSLLPAVLQENRSIGLLRGGVGGLTLEEIPRDVTMRTGEAVVTATSGDIVQSGLPIGTIATVLSTKSDVFQSARVTSPIDFSRLEVVFGVK